VKLLTGVNREDLKSAAVSVDCPFEFIAVTESNAGNNNRLDLKAEFKSDLIMVLF
jgi:hypothetical protein